MSESRLGKLIYEATMDAFKTAFSGVEQEAKRPSICENAEDLISRHINGPLAPLPGETQYYTLPHGGGTYAVCRMDTDR